MQKKEIDAKKEIVTTKEKPKVAIKKTQKLISFKEFFIGKNYRDERKAAFKVFLNGKLNHTNEEWEKLLEEFER